MGLDIYFKTYIGAPSDELLNFRAVETVREARYSPTTGERVDDYVETDIRFIPKNKVLNMESYDLYNLAKVSREFGAYVEESTLADAQYISLESDIAVEVNNFEISFSEIDSKSLEDFSAEIKEAEKKFRTLTGYEGKLKVYFVQIYSY